MAAERVALDLPPSGDSADSGPISLPTLKLPLSIELGEVAVGSFLLDGNQQVAELKLAAHWLADGLHIDSLTARGFGLDLALQGRLQPSGDWPAGRSHARPARSRRQAVEAGRPGRR